MKLKLVAIFAVVAVLVAGSLWLGGTATGAPSDPSFAPLTVKVEPAKAHKYVGPKNCRMCHKDHHKGWLATKMAKALESLKPGVKAEAKKKHGLDPAKDYTTDAKCLPCHVTGFGEPGGYEILGPKPDDKKAARKWKRAKRKMDALASVSCESCHGAGGAYTKIFSDIMKTKRKYKVEELYAAGLKKMDEKACINCHNDKSPTFDKEKGFDFKRDKMTDTHPHIPLKQRAE